MIITEKLRTKIVLHLPEKYAETIAEECSCHPNTVYNVLYRSSNNTQVAEAIILLAGKTKKQKEKKNRELTRIAEQL